MDAYRFLEGYGRYVTGDIAGLAPEHAADLVARRIVVPYDREHEKDVKGIDRQIKRGPVTK